MREVDVSEMRTAPTGATRDTTDGKVEPFGFLSALALLRYSEYMHRHRTQKDGTVRDSDNWQKGMPQSWYYNSLGRHILELELLRRELPGTVYPGETPHSIDDTLCSILFNVQALLHERALGRDVGSEPAISRLDLNAEVALNEGNLELGGPGRECPQCEGMTWYTEGICGSCRTLLRENLERQGAF
jgi:hypothetical protein